MENFPSLHPLLKRRRDALDVCAGKIPAIAVERTRLVCPPTRVLFEGIGEIHCLPGATRAPVVRWLGLSILSRDKQRGIGAIRTIGALAFGDGNFSSES